MTKTRWGHNRVRFGRGHTARIISLDGTWYRECRIIEVSSIGAKLTVKGSLQDLDDRKFFLRFSDDARRLCEQVWINDKQMGVRFVKTRTKPATAIRSERPEQPTSAAPALERQQEGPRPPALSLSSAHIA